MKKYQLFFIRIYLITFVIGIFCLAQGPVSAVDLPWSTSFPSSCGEQISPDINCDGVEQWGVSATSRGHNCQITAAANYDGNGAGGGLGRRMWIGPGFEFSMGAAVFFPGVSEIWIRWYMREEPGLYYGQQHKLIYLKDEMGVNSTCLDVACWGYNNFCVNNVGGDGMMVDQTIDFGQLEAFGNPVSDGSWHCYELHYKSETVTSAPFDGVVDFWVDGINRMHNTTFDHGLFHGGKKIGGFAIGQNTNSMPEFGRDYYEDYDDFAVQSGTPSNVDAQGRPMIGPIGWPGGSESCMAYRDGDQDVDGIDLAIMVAADAGRDNYTNCLRFMAQHFGMAVVND